MPKRGSIRVVDANKQNKVAKLDEDLNSSVPVSGLNQEIAKALQELGEFEKNVNGQIYKYNAYHKAAYSIAHCPVKINSGTKAMDLDGVGKKIASRIDEFVEFGKIKELEEMKHSDYFKSVSELNRVLGIGPAHARKFYREGVRKIEDLNDRKDELTHEQQLGLKYFQDFEKKIPREEVEKIEKLVIDVVERLDDKYVVTVCGSYRRGLPFSNDIDILITHPLFVSKSWAKSNAIDPEVSDHIVQYKKSPKFLLSKIIDKLIEIKFLSHDIIAFGDTKFMGICSLNNKSPFKRIDIRIFPHDEYYPALLYYTGSFTFNHEMRKLALQKGYTLNEYSLRKVAPNGVAGKPLHIKSERDIFDYLEMDYKRPNERNMD